MARPVDSREAAGERATLETPLAPGVEVFVLTAISGG